MAENSITAEKLCALTGLTDRRHRQLAKAGYFPPPLRGEYQLGPAIKGLFRYYNERLQKKDTVFEDARGREKSAKARLAEMAADIQEGKLLTVDAVSEANSSILTSLVTRLCNFGDGVANVCHNQPAEFIADRVNGGLRSALREVAGLPHVPEDVKKKTLQQLGFAT